MSEDVERISPLVNPATRYRHFEREMNGTWIEESTPYTETEFRRDLAFFRASHPRLHDDQVDSVHLLAATLGDHQAEEVEPGVYRHTFTPHASVPGVYDWWVSLPDQPCITPTVYVSGKREKCDTQIRKRTRRQHRATFRRRKRGLA